MDPLGGFMQWLSLCGSGSTKLELISHLGPEITLLNRLLGFMCPAFCIVSYKTSWPELCSFSLAPDTGECFQTFLIMLWTFTSVRTANGTAELVI